MKRGKKNMKLREGERYDITITLFGDSQPTTFYGMYFMWVACVDEVGDVCCGCCGKKVMKYPYVFRLPVKGACYDECAIRYYTHELIIGSSCIQKADIRVSFNEEPRILRH